MSERNECEHGQLARSCNICGYEEEITELQATIATQQATIDKLEKALTLAYMDRAFFKCCALSGETPTEGSEPSAKVEVLEASNNG